VEFYSGVFSELKAATQSMDAEAGNQPVVLKHLETIRKALDKIHLE